MKNRLLKTKLLTVLLTLCMVLSIVPITAYAGELPKPDYLPEGVTYSNDYDHTYHTQVNVTANVSVKDSDGTVVETTQVSKSTEEFLKVQLINVNSKMRKNLFYFLTKKGRTFPLVKISFFERY